AQTLPNAGEFPSAADASRSQWIGLCTTRLQPDRYESPRVGRRAVMRPVNSILVPVDFSAGSKHALAYAMRLADSFGTSLHVVHVLDDAFAAAGYLETYAGDYMEAAAQQAGA